MSGVISPYSHSHQLKSRLYSSNSVLGFSSVLIFIPSPVFVNILILIASFLIILAMQSGYRVLKSKNIYGNTEDYTIKNINS